MRSGQSVRSVRKAPIDLMNENAAASVGYGFRILALAPVSILRPKPLDAKLNTYLYCLLSRHFLCVTAGGQLGNAGVSWPAFAPLKRFRSCWIGKIRPPARPLKGEVANSSGARAGRPTLPGARAGWPTSQGRPTRQLAEDRSRPGRTKAGSGARARRAHEEKGTP